MANQAQQAPPQPLPFRVGTQPGDLQDFVPPAVTLGTSTQPLPVYHPQAESFLSGIYIQVVATTASNAATVAFKADAPWNVINTLSFTDVQSRFIIGPIGGFDLFVINLLGGYFNVGDPRASAEYSVTTGVGAGLGGSFTFVLYLPLQWDLRTGMGTLQNKSTASQYSLNVTLETEGNVYSTSPTSAPSVQVTYTQDFYLQPSASDAQGNPLAQNPQAIGSTEFWSKSLAGGAAVTSGSNPNVQLQGGLGWPIRNIFLENYDVSSGTRATGDTSFPSPLILNYKGVQLMNRNKTIWLAKMSRKFGLTGGHSDSAALGVPLGVYALEYDLDNTNQPGGAELGNGLLQTQTGTVLALNGSWATTCNCYELCNYIVPANGNPGSIRAGGR